MLIIRFAAQLFGRSEYLMTFFFDQPTYPKIFFALRIVSSSHGPSLPGTFHILIGNFLISLSEFEIIFFLSLTFPISLSDFYLIAP